MTEPKQLALIATLGHVIHPDWPERSLRTWLETHITSHNSYTLTVAAVACWADPATHKPARLAEAGPWWPAAHAATGEADRIPTPPKQLDESWRTGPKGDYQTGAARARAALNHAEDTT
ncbi:MAG: hypothetical protein ACRDMV_02325 [Streptosporangiales bacterium]